MENGWQMKCSPTLQLSNSLLASSAAAGSQIPPQESRNQMKMTLGHCTLPHDAQEPRLMPSGLKGAPTFSYKVNLGSGKPVPAESGHSFLSVVSTPSSLLQHNFQQQATLKSSSGSYYPAISNFCNTGAMSNWPLTQNNWSLNPSGTNPGVDPHPAFPFRTYGTATNHSVPGQQNEFDAARAVFSHAGSRIEYRGSTLHEGLRSFPSRSSNNEICHDSNGNYMLEAPMKAPCSVGMDQVSVGTASGCPRVFCMSACGDLLLSNMGLLGILCSCHCLHMSVSNFCKHSGLSDVNPGYAVRMETGECIAQWRKVYLHKIGIRAPDDHRGWDWPEGLPTTPSLLRHNEAVPDGSKVFDFSSLFSSSVEPGKSSQPRNSVFPSKPQLNYEFASKMSKPEQMGNGGYQPFVLMGDTVNLKRRSDNMTESPSSCLMASRMSVEGGSGKDCQSNSFNSNIIFASGNPYSLPYQNVQSISSRAQNNLKDEIVLQRDALPSSFGLNLGQPFHQGWGVGATTSSNNRDLQTTTFQEQLTHNLGNSKFNEHGNQHLYCHPASDLKQTKEQCQPYLLHKTPSIANGASRFELPKEKYYNSSEFSLLVTSTNPLAEGSSVHCMENCKGISGNCHSIPWRLYSQPHVDKCRLLEFTSKGGDGTIFPSGIMALGLEKKEDSINITRCGQFSNIGNGSSFGLYAQQVENSGFFTKGGKPSHPNICTVAVEKSLGMAGMQPDVYCASKHIDRVHELGSIPKQGHVNSSLGFGTAQTPQASSFCSIPLTLVHGSGHVSTSLDKDVHAANLKRSDGTLRVLALGGMDQSLKGKPADTSMGLNQRQMIHPGQKERIKNCSLSNVRVEGSFLDPGPSKGSHENLFTNGSDATPTFVRDTGGRKTCDFGNGFSAEGNNWENFQVFSSGLGFNSELTDKYAQSSCVLRPEEQPSIRGENKVIGCNKLQRCSERTCTCISGRCYCTAPSLFSDKDCHSKDTRTMNGLKRKIDIAGVEAATLDGFRLSGDSGFIEKPVVVECSQKMKEKKFVKLDGVDSRCKDVPIKANLGFKLNCPKSIGQLLGKNGETEYHLKDIGVQGFFNDPFAELEQDVFSNVSSGSSAPSVTQASIEVEKVGSSTIFPADTGIRNDQMADQGSVINVSCSSVDDDNSFKSSQHVGCGKAGSIEEISVAESPNLASHCFASKIKQRHSESKEVQNIGDSGARYDEVSETIQKNETGFKMRKRKHGLKSKLLGTSLAVSHVTLLPSDSLPDTRNASDNLAHACQDVPVFLQSKQDSSDTFDANVEDHSCKRRRYDLSVVENFSDERDLRARGNILDSEMDDKGSERGNNDAMAIPENFAVEESSQVKPAEFFMEPIRSDEATKQVCLYNPDSGGTLRCTVQGCQNSVLASGENICYEKVKPVACGKYGVLCNQESDLDQSKPPKIVPLDQVLNPSRKLSKCENEHALDSARNVFHCSDDHKIIYGSSTSSNGQVIKVLSCKCGFCETSAHETLQTQHIEDGILADDRSAQGEVVLHGRKNNTSSLSCCPGAQLKPKEIRVRSLYELSVKGKEFLSADFSLCQTLVCELSTGCELGRETYKDAGGIDVGKCSSVARRSLGRSACSSVISDFDALCCVCGISNKDNSNSLLECNHCFIRIHQACYGISRVSKGDWYCRPCKTGAKNVACVLCGYGGGAMTRAFGSRVVVKSLLKAWNIRTESHITGLGSAKMLYVPAKMDSRSACRRSSSIRPVVHNSIIAGLFDRQVRQWVHMVCGLWTRGTRRPNADSMSAFDVSGVCRPKAHMVCHICKRPGGTCTKCHVETCNSYFHPWCAHQKGLLQSEVESFGDDKVGFYGRCLLHANRQPSPVGSDDDTSKIDSDTEEEKEPTCARTKVYRGKKLGGKQSFCQRNSKVKCLVSQVQLDAWQYINRQKLGLKRLPKTPVSDADQDYRKEYARYKQAKGWKQLVVYKSGIHGLGLYTSQFIPREAMVVEYVGEIVGPRVADKRESEYLSGRKLQYKGACYFFRIDKEQIIDATRKGGIARFVNHSCQPNCVAKVITVRSEKKVVFFAQRDIYPGEEITYDYHFNHEDEGKKIPCFCKSDNCRRYLN